MKVMYYPVCVVTSSYRVLPVRGVLWVMQNRMGDERDDAAGVLRNCANYSQAAAEVIVQTPGVLEALIDLCKGPYRQTRFNAMGTIQNLTRCGCVAHLLCQTRIVAHARGNIWGKSP